MEKVTFRGILKGHAGMVTSLATSMSNPDILVSGSRDRTVMAWKLLRTESEYGRAQRCMPGHAHFVSDIALSNDANFVLSSSWDCTMRLWDLTTGTTTRRFVGHTRDVLSVAFSADNRQIVSGSRDKNIFLWNTLGECKYTFSTNPHTEWVSAVRFSPNVANPIVVSAGWDNIVKVWTLGEYTLKYNLVSHTGYVNSIGVSPDGSLCATGGRDGKAILWDLNRGLCLDTLEGGSMINALAFNPHHYWICAATEKGVRVWDIGPRKVMAEISHHHPDFDPQSKTPVATAVAWGSDGKTIFVGYSDNVIRVWEITP